MVKNIKFSKFKVWSEVDLDDNIRYSVSALLQYLTYIKDMKHGFHFDTFEYVFICLFSCALSCCNIMSFVNNFLKCISYRIEIKSAKWNEKIINIILILKIFNNIFN